MSGLQIVVVLGVSACSYDWSTGSSSPSGGGDAISAGGRGGGDFVGAGGYGAGSTTSTGSRGASGTTSTGTGTGSVSASTSATSGAGGDESTGGMTGSGGGGVAPCGSAGFDALQDTFSGSAVDLAKWNTWTEGSAVLSVSGGQLAVTLPRNSGASWAGIDSKNRYDLIDCQVSVRVLEAPSRDANAFAHFTVQIDENNYIAFEHWSTELAATSNIGEAFLTIETVPYDPVAHAYWRIREVGGVSYWETSADGTAWTLLASRPDPIPVRGLVMVIGAGTSRRETVSPGAFRIDDVNVIP